MSLLLAILQALVLFAAAPLARQRGYTAAKLAHYADLTMGRAYFHQEERLAAWRKSKASYRLSPDKQRTAAVIAAKYGGFRSFYVDFDKMNLLPFGHIPMPEVRQSTGEDGLGLVRPSGAMVKDGNCGVQGGQAGGLEDDEFHISLLFGQGKLEVAVAGALLL